MKKTISSPDQRIDLKSQYQTVLKSLFTVFLLLCSMAVSGQVWTYNFGTATATVSGTTADASSSFPAPSSGSLKARIGSGTGTSAGSFVLANPGLALGTDSELQFKTNGGTTSATKFGINGFTAGKQGYLKFKMTLNSGTVGTYGLAIGSGATMSDNTAVATSQTFAGVQWAFGSSNAITYQVLNNATFGATGISNSTSLFSQDINNIYEVEIYYNNTTASIDYNKSGVNSLTNARWDLWINGTKVGSGLAKGGFGTNIDINSFLFYHQANVVGANAGTIYLDDIEYSNTLPTAPACTTPTQSFASASVTKNTGDPDFTNAFTTNSTGAVTYSSDTPAVATINSSTGLVTIVGAGTAIIKASQTADATFCTKDLTYNLTVNSTDPTITTTGNLTAMSTTYGTASTPPGSFDFTASNLTGSNLTVTAPAGFEISTSSGGSYGTSLNYTLVSGGASGTAFVRLAATTNAGFYSGNVVLTDGAITPVNVNIPNSTVNTKGLTIGGLTGLNKVYDAATTASVAGTPTLNGTVNGDVITLTGTPTYSFADKIVNNGKQISVSGFSLSGAKAGNYTLTTTNVATANITKKDVTITGSAAQNKSYDGNTNATITGGTTSGVIAGDTATLVSGTGTFAQSNVGTGIAVTANYSLTGADAANYNVLQPTGLTANITAVAPTITTSTINIAIPTPGTYTLAGPNVTSNSAGAFSYSLGTATPPGSVTLTGGNVLNGIAAGTATLTVNQVADGNYTAGSATVTVNVTTVVYNDGDYRTLTSGNWPGATGAATWERYDGSTTTWIQNSTPSSNAVGNLYILHAITSNGSFAPASGTKIIVENGGKFTDNHSSTLSLIHVKNGGTFEVGATGVTLVTTGGVKLIESGGTLLINAALTNTSTFWRGSENFQKGSIVNFSDYNGTLLANPSQISNNTNNYLFGNLKFSGTTTITLIGTNSATDFNLTENNLELNSASNNILIASAGSKNIIINGNATVNAGTLRSMTALSSITINGDLEINNSGTVNVGPTSNGSIVFGIKLKGDLKMLNTSTLTTTDPDSELQFIGPGDGLTPETTQFIDVANNSTVTTLTLNVNSGAYAKLRTQNLSLGTSSKFNVLSGGTLDFGFDGIDGVGTNPLNIIRVSSQSGQIFNLNDGGTLKITSPLGITTFGDFTGNVQIGTTSAANRVFGTAGIYHYIGKVNQVSGNGLPSTAGDKKVIVELTNDNLKFWATPESGVGSVKRFTSGGGLEIRKGMVYDGQNPDVPAEDYGRFADAVDTGASLAQSGNLTMTGGRYILYHSAVAAPHLSGNYNLTGGVIQFDGNDQSIRAPKTYLTVEVTGKNVGTPAGNITLQSISTPAVIDGSLTVKNGGEFLINSNSIVGPTGTQVLTVENGGVFKTGDANGFSGTTATSVKNDIETINLNVGSTVEYSRAGAQTITHADVSLPANANYQNLRISGSGIKTAQGETKINQMTTLTSEDATLLVPEYNATDGYSVLYASGGINNTNGTTGKLIVGNDSQLMQNANATNTNAVIEARRNLNLTDGRKEYNYLISPVDVQTMKSIIGGNAANIQFVTRLNEATNMFVNAGVGAYVPGLAYAVKEPKLGVTDFVANFIGKPANGDFDFGLMKTLASRGYNLSGNPYPSNLDLDKLYAASENVDSSFRFWDNKVNATYVQQGGSYSGVSYATYNANSKTGSAATGENGIDPTGIPNNILKVGQGFMIRVLPTAPVNTTGPAATLAFKNSQRITEQTEAIFFGKSVKTSTKDRYWLEYITPSNLVVSNAIVYFEGGTNSFSQDDSRQYGSPSDALYSLVDEAKIIINGRSPFVNTDIIPLGIKGFTAGTYKIKLGKKEGIFANGQSVYLKDKELGIYTDLSSGAYSFASNNGEFTNRFEIVYKEGTVLGTESSSKSMFDVYRDGLDFVVRSSYKPLELVELYDISGRLLLQLKGNSNEIRFNSELIPDGTYILKSKVADGSVYNKKIRK